ncbi:hypothetical protein CC86DRAFT_414892 [Ophiobolus disseminans]|uniref:Uncharacterized protein n=1 Tax=Ophiobolus disseminans TaxID=1469910 RepID=A0A6A7AKA0_9PLEO|nr:hypothetical protein CC86DRAFT_414892 [Ophiobolus disseminans]
MRITPGVYTVPVDVCWCRPLVSTDQSDGRQPTSISNSNSPHLSSSSYSSQRDSHAILTSNPRSQTHHPTSGHPPATIAEWQLRLRSAVVAVYMHPHHHHTIEKPASQTVKQTNEWCEQLICWLAPTCGEFVPHAASYMFTKEAGFPHRRCQMGLDLIADCHAGRADACTAAVASAYLYWRVYKACLNAVFQFANVILLSILDMRRSLIRDVYNYTQLAFRDTPLIQFVPITLVPWNNRVAAGKSVEPLTFACRTFDWRVKCRDPYRAFANHGNDLPPELALPRRPRMACWPTHQHKTAVLHSQASLSR